MLRLAIPERAVVAGTGGNRRWQIPRSLRQFLPHACNISGRPLVFGKHDSPKSNVQGLLGQCALAIVAILGALATLNLELAELIIRETVRIHLSPFLLYFE